MSLDMTIGARSAEVLAEADAAVVHDSAPATRYWLQDLAMVAGTTFGVVAASALGVLLFLR
jgi:hypothetical protein